jgi:hypothetical protein
MATAAGKKEPKNPARVDAALRTHLRRMDAQVRFRTGVAIAGVAAFMVLVTFQPMRPGRTGVCASLSLVASMFAAVGLIAAWHTRKRTRGKLLRTCRGCGYDLRATPDVCPECATPIPGELRRAREMGKDKLFMSEAAKE